MRFNDRACALMDIPDLPQSAFEHIGDRKIKPQGGGGGGIPIVSDVVNAISDVGESFDKTITQPVGKALSEVDTTVNREVPGGWVTVGAATVPFLAPEIMAFAAPEAAFTGLTETGLATLAGEGALADTVGTTLLAGAPEIIATETIGQALPYTEAFDAFNLAQQGLTPSQIGTTLSVSGVDPAIGQYMGELAAQGLSPEAIAQEVANLQLPSASQYNVQDVMEQARSTNVPAGSPTSVYTGEKPFITPGMAVQGARLGMGLLGSAQPQQQPRQPQLMIGGAQPNAYGGVDYSGLLNLLTPRIAARNPNSLLG